MVIFDLFGTWFAEYLIGEVRYRPSDPMFTENHNHDTNSLAGEAFCLVEVLNGERGVDLILIVLLELACVAEPLGDEKDATVHQVVHRQAA